jgi:hypothetical protein
MNCHYMMDINRAYVTGDKRKGFLRRNIPRLGTLLMTAAAGVLIGTQIYNPNKRTIEAIAGGVLLLILWRYSTLSALLAFLVMYPFPFSISWGTSNEIFVVIIGLVVLIRVASGALRITIDTKIRWPLALIVASYFLSLKNIMPDLLRPGIINTFSFLTAAVFMVLVINFIDDEVKLRRLLNFAMISLALFIAFTIIELLFPGRVIIPNWLYTAHKARLVMKGVRMGGPFHDYELAAEFFTLNAFIVFFMFIRSGRMLVKAMFGALLTVDIFMMFTTITRGAIFSLIVGVAYLMFLSRKDLNIVRISIIVGALTLILVVMEGVVARYTTSGSLFERVVATTFEKGLVPSNRVGTWFPAIERGMKFPLFGNGPGWDFRAGLTTGFWPHSLYLFYFNITGLFGLGAFLFLVVRIVKSTLSGVRASIVTSPFPEALMKILHVMIIIFLFDQIKIEYLRNNNYTYFVWFLFGLIIATHNIIIKQRAERDNASEAS